MMTSHPNIVKLKEVLASKSKIYLILELIQGGELLDLIIANGKVKPEQMRIYFNQIVSSLLYCRSLNIAHRDLKPENILIDSKQDCVKVSDFGLSCLYNDPSNLYKMMHTTCGTVNYLAPEVIQNKGYDGHIADVWSLGVVLYFSLFGTLPFKENSTQDLLNKIVTANYEMPKTASKHLKDLLSQILEPIPNKRITLDKIQEHPWVLGGIDSLTLQTNFQQLQVECIEEEENAHLNKYGRVSAINIKRVENDKMCNDNSPIKIISNLDFIEAASPQKNLQIQDCVSNLNSQLQINKLKPRKISPMEIIFLASSNALSSVQTHSLSTTLPSQNNITAVIQQIKSLKSQNQINELISQSLIFQSYQPIDYLNLIINELFHKSKASSVIYVKPEQQVSLQAIWGDKMKSLVIQCNIFKLDRYSYLIHFQHLLGDSYEKFLKVMHRIYLEFPPNIYNSQENLIKLQK